MKTPFRDLSMADKPRFGTLATGSAAYLASTVVSGAIPFALLPVLARYLTPAEYGQVAIFQALLGGLGAVVGLNVAGAAAVKYYDTASSPAQLKQFIGSCMQVLGMSTAVLLLLAVGFGKALSNWLGIDAHWVVLSVIVSGATFVVGMRTSQWQVRNQALTFGAFQVSQSLTNMLLSLVVVVGFLQGANGRIAVLSGTPIVFAIFSLVRLHRDGLLGFAWRPAYVREALLFGVPLIPHTAGQFVLASVDRLVINARMDLAHVGMYMVAVQLVSVMGVLFSAINSSYVPWLFERLKRGDPDEKKQIVRWTYGYYGCLLAIVALAFAVGPSVLILVAGQRYAEGGTVIGWLALGQAFDGMYLMVTGYVFFSKRTGLLSVGTIASGLSGIGLMMLLIPLFGLKGAAIAYAAAMALKFLFTWRLAGSRYPMPWLDSHVFNRTLPSC